MIDRLILGYQIMFQVPALMSHKSASSLCSQAFFLELSGKAVEVGWV
jgi:hypothetical protein